MSPSSLWQTRRSAFNHDWLKNQYMPALAKWARVLDGQVEDPAFESRFLGSILPAWERHGDEARRLLRDFESDMSPRTLLARPPLARLDDRRRRLLGRLAHELWLRRYPVREWVSRATAALDGVDRAYRQLQEALLLPPPPPGAPQAAQRRLRLEAFRESCLSLAKAVEQFPARMLVV